MINMVYGAVGVVAVLLLFFGGAIIGWKARVAYEKHNNRIVREELTEEKKRQFLADQEAFDAMINYSPAIAYGTQKPLAELAKKE